MYEMSVYVKLGNHACVCQTIPKANVITHV